MLKINRIRILIFSSLLIYILNDKNIDFINNAYFNQNIKRKFSYRFLDDFKYVNQKKNLIVGIIENYSINSILPFFRSFIRADFKNCDIVMFVRKVSENLINYLKSIGVIVYNINKKYKNIHVINLRWVMYIDFLQEHKDKYNLVFSCDVRDTIFQKDVFVYYANKQNFLGVAIEDGAIKNSIFNKNWIIGYKGIQKYEIIKNERIICVGSIWGTYDKFLEFCIIFSKRLLANPSCVEQGIGNYMFYYEKIFNDSIIKSDNYGPVITIGRSIRENIFLDSENNILNYAGDIAGVVHQYDRKKDITEIIYKKFCPEIIKSNNQHNISSSSFKNEFECYENDKNIIDFLIFILLFTLILLLKSMFNRNRNTLKKKKKRIINTK